MPDNASSPWEPPARMSREELIAASDTVLARTPIPFSETEHVFRVHSLGLDWDIGVMVYEPDDPARIPTGADGRKIGMFVLHGGAGDYRSMEQLCRLLAGRFGYKIASMTYPGRLYLDDPSRDWPGDTIHPDGTVRTPIWQIGETIGPDQYSIVQDTSLRGRYGTRFVARPHEGSRFYDRMAAWPAAFEDAMKQVCHDHLPDGEFSIYVHGHSTGGPFVHMLSQRVDNIRGVVGIENSPFGYMYQQIIGIEWAAPFEDLLIRTWRDIARYTGAEVRSQEGEAGLMRLPWVMEEVFDAWNSGLTRPQFKAEYPVHYGCLPAMTAAAKAAARRLDFNAEETDALIARYCGYTREISGPDTRPVPPILLSICQHSRDHTEQRYDNVVVPMFAKMNPAPKVRVVKLGAGTHHYEWPEDDLPEGLVAPTAGMWHDAITQGYYLGN